MTLKAPSVLNVYVLNIVSFHMIETDNRMCNFDNNFHDYKAWDILQNGRFWTHQIIL